jgi:hypothetical protein
VQAPAAPQLRPLSIGEVLDVAIKIYWRNAWTLFRIVVVVVAPVQVVSALLDASAVGGSSTQAVTAFGATSILSLVASTLANGACFKAIAGAYLGERQTWRSSLRFAFGRLHSILWVTLLATVLTIIGIFFCIIPAIYLWIAFAVSIPVLLTEDVKGSEALGRSRRLVSDRWWSTFGIVLLGTILAGIVSAVVGGLAGFAAGSAGPDTVTGFVARAIGGVLGSMISTPFTAAFVTVLYFDLRVRKEGFDLQLLAERIGLAPPAEGGFRPGPESAGFSAPVYTGPQPPYWPPPPGWKPAPEDEPGR